MSGYDTREKVCPPLTSDLSPTEDRVVRTYFAGIAPMTCTAARFLGGDVVLDVQYLAHRQQVRGRTLLDALAQCERLFKTFHTAQEAA